MKIVLRNVSKEIKKQQILVNINAEFESGKIYKVTFGGMNLKNSNGAILSILYLNSL